jgi:hypothetical protein
MQPMTRYNFASQWQGWRLVLMGVLALSLLLFRPVQGQPQRPFTNASLHGPYAVVGSGGNHTAASIGIETYDGQGNFTRTLRLNEQAAGRSREVVTITGQGTYHVQPNGMGTAEIINTLPDGSTFTSELDFVITRATTASPRGAKVATEVFSILRETGIAASLVTFVLTRLPE